MRPKGGVLRVAVGAVELTESEARVTGDITAGRYAAIRISDTGHGMDEATREQVFVPFFTTKGAGEGTGLGLSTCYGIVAGHGGAITVETAPGAGSTFSVYLPLTEAPVEDPLPWATAPLAGHGRILFVDDEPALTAIGQRMLERLGFQATVASSGEEALARLQADPEGYALVLTDQTMPGLTGLDLVAALRPLSPHVPVIVMTGFLGDLAFDTLTELRVGEVLAKPFTVEELAEAIRRVLPQD
jgi:CheY-like chemotaxis protein